MDSTVALEIHSTHRIVPAGAAADPSVWCSDCARLVKGEHLGITASGSAPCPATYVDDPASVRMRDLALDRADTTTGSKATPGGEPR